MSARRLWQVIVKTAVAILCAGLFHVFYLAVFLVTFRSCGPILRGLILMAAPVFNATGFTVGIWFCERHDNRRRFVHILPWPLIACSLGAAAICWRGPMLIVFGMFAAGTASVILREVVAAQSKGGHGP